MNRETKTLFFCFLFVLSVLPLSPVIAEQSLPLYATVIAPDYTLFRGRGYINLGDQMSIGSATMTISSEGNSISIKIIQGGAVVEAWSWTIVEKSHTSQQYRTYQYTKDTYTCKDSDENTLTVNIIGYYRKNSVRVIAFAYGNGVLFSGQRR